MQSKIAPQQLQDEQLRRTLLEEYQQQDSRYPDSETVQTIKSELYRRGYKRSDVVEIALASLIRSRVSDN
jgi:hypothetical protein